MAVLSIILLLIILVLLMSIKSNLNGQIDDIRVKLDSLTAKLNKLGEQERQTIQKREGSELEAFTKRMVEKTSAPVEKTPPPVIPSKMPGITPEKTFEQVNPPVKPEPVKTPGPVPVFTSRHSPEHGKQEEDPIRGFFERNPDLEKFIGENLANKIGIGVLVLGIGFFVKYAIDKEWVGVYGRVFIGILCGGVLITLAHRLRQSFAAFSSVLVGGGIAVLYLTITIGFHEYQIISQTAAFMIMVIITAFTILISVAYNRMELAILAILGGFGSPFMVSTGEGNFVVLFTYILILDVGMLVLAYYKKWNTVTVISYIFSIILFGSWLGMKYDGSYYMMSGAIIFATLFYTVFFIMNIINNLKERTKFGSLEFSLLLSNTFLYYTAGMFILNYPEGEVFKGLFTATIGVFNFIFAYVLFKTARVDRNLVFLLIGLVLTFISLAAPIQLEGNYITLFWAAESVLLLWLSQQSGIRLMKLASVLVMGLMLVSLLMDWNNIYGVDPTVSHLRVILNKGYITTFVSLLSIGLVSFLLKFEKDEYKKMLPHIRLGLSLIGLAVLYMWNFLELDHQLKYFAEPSAIDVVIGSYNMLFILFIIALEKKIDLTQSLRSALAGLGVFAAILYFARYHNSIIRARDSYLFGTSSFVGFAAHYLLITLLVLTATWSVNRFRKLNEFNSKTLNLYSWFFVFLFLFLASAELDHTILMTLYNEADHQYLLTQNHKIGYPILWGISSFILIAIGLKKKRRHLRIISLTLFLVTLLKLFLIDIKGISEGGKIAAFISLGILLLIVSFMYQRVKKFLMADEEAASDNIDKNK